jgi:hypothetical protein
MDEPIELPDGRLVCKAHQLTVCANCCVDYSFMDEILDNNEDEVDDHNDEAEDDKDEGSAQSDDDELLTEEEMAAFRARMVAIKGMFSSPLQVFPSGTD